MTNKNLVTLAEIIVPFDGDEAKAQKTANLLAMAAPDMLEALEALFEHCAMPHKHWGDGSNQKEAIAAIAAGHAAIAKARGA